MIIEYPVHIGVVSVELRRRRLTACINVMVMVDVNPEKRRVYGDEATGGGGGGAASAGLSRFTVGWVSKASAEQRAG